MIFPKIEGQPGYVNLALYAPAWLARNGYEQTDENPLLDPDMCERMVQELHEELGIAYSYGGWLEDRTELWRGSYLDAMGPHLHLGVDLNVPAGTHVACHRGGRVLRIDKDNEAHGWGTRIFIRPTDRQDVVLLYAHLGVLSVREMEPIAPGDVFGLTGPASANGGWFPHLHVQALSREAYDLFKKEPDALDGYGPAGEREQLARLYPDPIPFIGL
ncbi:MAG: peptidoglycan DD-metalloendopeptidase family protein [Bacillota bacterium]